MNPKAKALGRPPKSIKKEIQDELNPSSTDRNVQKEFFMNKVEEFIPDKFSIESKQDLSHYSYILDQ